MTRLTLERHRIADALTHVARVLEDPACSSLELHACAVDLGTAMGLYTSIEDGVVPDVLRQLDAWGPERVEQMLREHRLRRQLLSRALDALAALSAGATSDGVREMRHLLAAMGAEVLHELAEEEDQFLRPDLLHDDLTEVDEFGG